jgi:hypothetical protein
MTFSWSWTRETRRNCGKNTKKSRCKCKAFREPSKLHNCRNPCETVKLRRRLQSEECVHRFILTQGCWTWHSCDLNLNRLILGPLRNTAADFWLMVWEERTREQENFGRRNDFAMTTKIFVNGFQKCFPYWRLNEGGRMKFGRFEIETISVERNKDYTLLPKLALSRSSWQWFMDWKLIRASNRIP